MKVLKRTKDFKLLAIEALVRHAKPNMRKDRRLQKELSIRTAGYFGEKNVDYMLRTYPFSHALALPDIRLEYNNYEFQLDTLILTPQICIILEAKNWAGELEYDSDLRQIIQRHAGNTVRYRCPIAQVEKQKMNLTGWLLEHGQPSLPIKTHAVISNDSTILTNHQHDQHFSEKVFHADLLHEKLNDLFSTINNNKLPLNIIRNMTNYIGAHKIYQYDDILTRMVVSREQLIRGIPCEKCWIGLLIRRGHGWHCNHCGYTGKDAHIQAIYDYFLLNGMKPISNKELRQFLNVSSRNVIYTLLQSMNLKMNSTRRHAVYHAPTLEQFPQNSNMPPIH